MPRIGRVVAQNMPHHIVQHGHNKNAVFVENEDYSYYLNTLVEWTQLLSPESVSSNPSQLRSY
jgi:putative transposase